MRNLCQFELIYLFKKHKLTVMISAMFVFALPIFAMTNNEFFSIVAGEYSQNILRNAPYVVQEIYHFFTFLVVLGIYVYMTYSAHRDYATRMNHLVFVTPMRKHEYFFGRFFGGLCIGVFYLFVMHLAIAVTPFMPWATQAFGSLDVFVHIHMLLTIGIPMIFVFLSFSYALEMFFPQKNVSVIMLLMIPAIDAMMIHTSQTSSYGVLLTPNSLSARIEEGRSYTTEMINTMLVPFHGLWALHALVWCSIALLLLMASYQKFRFVLLQKNAHNNQRSAAIGDAPRSWIVPARTVLHARAFSSVHTIVDMIRMYIHVLTKNKWLSLFYVSVFIIALSTPIITEGIYGSNHPYTFLVFESFNTLFYFGILSQVIYYSIELAWCDREYGIQGIIDASPTPSWVRIATQAGILYGIIIIVHAIMASVGVGWQLLAGMHIDWKLYVLEMFLFFPLKQFYWVVLFILIGQLVNNKGMAYILTGFIFGLNFGIARSLNLDFHLFQYASIPSYRISEMSGYGTHFQAVLWHHAYWFAWGLVLLVIASWWIMIGEPGRFQQRWTEARRRLMRTRLLFSVLVLVALSIGGWIVYNTVILNNYMTASQREDVQKRYELSYKKYEKMDQPKWTAIHFDVDLYPSTQRIAVRVNATIQNKTARPIDTIHFSMPFFVAGDQERMRAYAIMIKGAELIREDAALGFRSYRLKKPLSPNEQIDVTIDGNIQMRGFENNQPFPNLVKNGSFIHSQYIFPTIGYNRNIEVIDATRREALGLPNKDPFPSLDKNDQRARSHMAMISSDADWITTSTRISTEKGQIAVAPGALVRSWSEDDRPHFLYETKGKALHFHAFLSAHYAVTRATWQGIALEVYHDPRHAANVPRMLDAMRASLSYYTQHFGAYTQPFARIVEFPRGVAIDFAQAFLGTIPYSENIGFMLDLRDLKPHQIDLISFVVAHEMAHQYWAHQFIGAHMQGARVLDEVFAQYSAQMVVEQLYSREKTRVYSKKEQRLYVQGRVADAHEKPLMFVEQQQYMVYQKGLLAMLHLREAIGEKAINTALRTLLEQYRYQDAPYPTVLDAIDAFRAVTPSEHQQLITDLFENITLYEHETVSAEAIPLGNDEYEVTIKTSSRKFYSDGKGKDKEVPISDVIEIAVFAPPKEDGSRGKKLYSERPRITKKDNTWVFRVRGTPHEVGIDPDVVMISRDDSKNMRDISMRSARK